MADNSERMVKLTDLIEDRKLLESLLSLDCEWLQVAAVHAARILADDNRLSGSTFEITFQNPGKYKIVRSSIPSQR